MYLLVIQDSYKDDDIFIHPHGSLKAAQKHADDSFDVISDGLIATILYQDNLGHIEQVLQANYCKNQGNNKLIWTKG